MSGHGWHYTPCRDNGLAVTAVIGAAVLLGSGAITTAIAALTSLLEIVLACTVTAVLIVTAAAVLTWRRYGHRTPSVPEQIAAFREARQVRAVPLPAVAAPTQLHIHYHGTAQPEGVPAVLRAIAETTQGAVHDA